MSGSGRWLLGVGLAVILIARPASAEQIQPVEVEVGGRTVHALCTDGPRRVVLLQGESDDLPH